MQKQKQIKWEPAAKIKPQDSIKSSNFTNYKPLIPSYLKEQPNMTQLLSMDYARQWIEEKIIYEKSIKPSTNIEHLDRRFVKRGLNTKKQNVNAKCHSKQKTVPVNSDSNKK